MHKVFLFPAALLVEALSLCTTCAAQPVIMQFSVYNNWSISSDGMLYNAGSAIDNSTCYSNGGHSGYVTTVSVHTPDGRVASVQNPGLSGNASIALNDITGDYILATSGTYHCGCSGGQSGYGGAFTLPLRKTVYSLAHADPCGCDYTINCQGGTSATCSTGVYSTYSINACGCSSITWVKVYYWWRGGSVCTAVWERINPSDKTCS